jgi:hypothetical protein
MPEACSFDPLRYLLFRVLNRFSAGSAFFVLKELHLSASFVLAAYHDRSSAGITFLASGERLTVTKGTGYRQCPSAAGTQHVTVRDASQTVRALIPERASASALGAETAVPLDHIVAMDTGLLVCGHLILPHEPCFSSRS